jgi:PTH1 family peptidyl-tRNA hydrolase
MIKLIVGLGNPGNEYAATRHNAGFWYIDALAQKFALTLRLEGKYFAEVAKAKLFGGDVWLIKPQTFMNLSGKAVSALAGFYKIKPEEILVVHDELDFAPGSAKLKQGGGNGGHNGLKDIDRVIGTNYWRLRVGIGHPGSAAKVPSYVLKKPPVEELTAIEQSITKAVAVSAELIGGELAKAQKILHTK